MACRLPISAWDRVIPEKVLIDLSEERAEVGLRTDSQFGEHCGGIKAVGAITQSQLIQ